MIKEFKFTEIQAQAILDMQLRRLAALERKKLQDEYKELLERISYLEELLAHPEKILGVIKEDLKAIREKYGDARRTQIVDRTKGTLTSTDLLPDLDAWVSVGASGELTRQDQAKISPTVLRQIGKGAEVALLAANTRDVLYLFSQDGRSARLSVHEIPQNGSAKHLAELTEFTRRDDITAALAIPRITADESQGYLCLVTKGGSVKRVSMTDLLAANASDLTVINVDSNDRLGWVFHSSGKDEVILVSSAGKSIRFDENDVRSMGLAAGGIGGMKLKKGEQIVYAGVVDPNGELLTFTQNGFAKRSSFDQYSTQGAMAAASSPTS
ncbi:MAG: hypothetical protein HC802_22085 [Caldilineaceae bacterium]|nr:hypothetical protein [Caldilineaceae bacterium]